VKDVVIIDALRTPIGKFRGKLSHLSAVDLGVVVTKALLERHSSFEYKIDEVIFGNVLQAGVGQNPARQIALKSGLAVEIPAMTVNEVCGSGLKALALAQQAIQLGKAQVVLAGGTESMSQAPYYSYFNKETGSYSQPNPIMVHDGLTDAFSGKHMGLTAENVAEQYNVLRTAVDKFALNSHLKAARAQENGWFDAEIVPVLDNEGNLVMQDEGVRKHSSLEKLATLNPVFKEEGQVTAGNASTVNDGASVVLLASKEFAENNNLPYLATIKDIVEIGIEPSIMGISPITAITKLLERNQLTKEQIDAFEINEAFATTSLVVEQQLGLDSSKVNMAGGGISLGHPIGASGARIVTTALNQLQRVNGRFAVASLCVGGGLGLAILLEKPKHSFESEKKFYQLAPKERREKLFQQGKITKETKETFAENGLSEEIANHLIENQISDFSLPLGVALNFKINQTDYVIPLATEEPSVVAACSNGAKMALANGGFTSTMPEKYLRGQIVLMNVQDSQALKKQIELKQAAIFERAAEVYPSIIQRGGGVKALEVRLFEESPSYVSVDLIVDTKDAMGANILNTILEGVANLLREWFSEEILFSILSNYATESLVTTTCLISFEQLSKEKDPSKGKEIAEKIAHASLFAKLDPYRATTNNKGIMNGIEALVLATGNDTRAVSASIHAYAARHGKYEGLSTWTFVPEGLKGELTIPLALGSVGGATRVLPKAQAALDLLQIDSATKLAQITAAVGLAQNLAALRALVSEGIQQGHMALQARSLALSVGAQGLEVQQVASALKDQAMNEKNARKILQAIRQ
jgi:hydroxymethylglutaryl-CoA reductase